MEHRLILTSGVAATKRWCCLFHSLHYLYIAKELENQILKLHIRAFFWWKKPQPAILQKLGL